MNEHVHFDETTPWVRRWLRAEGLAGLALGWVVWQSLGGGLLWFVPALLLPDVSMLGYLRGPHAGAIGYNLAHNWLVGGLVLVAHTGGDRLLGYGLKYPTSFQDTHLGRIGRR